MAEWVYWRPCDHCGGTIIMTYERNHLRYTCERCGCAWAWGFFLVHRGESCPVHGTYAQHAAALAPDELRPLDDPDYVPF